MKRLLEKYKDQLSKMDEYEIGGKSIHIDLSEIPNDLDPSELNFTIRENDNKYEIQMIDKKFLRYMSYGYPKFIVDIPNWLIEVLKITKTDEKIDIINKLITSLPEKDQEQFLPQD